ncbi:MAG: hypothetical protein ACLR4Z_11325 [Butyricicoccaceae bacterium]
MFDRASHGSRCDHFFIHTGTLPKTASSRTWRLSTCRALRRFLKENCRRAEVCDQ